ncbi:MAG: hypothetical protein Q4C33_01450 [bacterium]|nr:hypothetical protein [bacterium]
MKTSMQKYKKRLITLNVMLLAIVLLAGVSYAVFTGYSSQTDTNTLAGTCIDLEFSGINEINLTNNYPIKDLKGLEQTPYTFTVKNNCDNYIEYYVIASVINASTSADSKYIKVSLLGDNDMSPSVITSLKQISTPQSLSSYNIKENYVLKEGDGITKDETRTFNFRMWLDGENQTSWTSEELENKTYQVKISVVGTVKTRPKDDLVIATTINGKASSTFPETGLYAASVSCTQNNKTVDIGAAIKWTGSKWSLGVTNLTSGNTKCVVAFDPPTLADAILANNEVKTPLTTPGKEVSAHTKDDITYTPTASVSSTYQAYFITYGTGYEANGTNFNLTGTAVTSVTYANSYSSLVGKYLPYQSISSSGSNAAGTMKTTTNLNSVYYVVSATQNSFTYKQITSNKNTTEALLASAEDDYGTSYYFRGAVKNNYVEFASKCWRIVRITGDGSVKLVLHNDNTSKVANPCSSANNSTNAAFARYSGTKYTSKFNEKVDDNAYVGFMYGTAGTSDYASTHANINKSTILKNLETWYTNNLAPYESKLADTIWCNDKSTVSGGLGYGTNATDYAAFNRLFYTKQPTLKCPNDNNGEKFSKFTVDDTTNGNGNLTYKAGLLTVDEISFSGFEYYARNLSTYLHENSTSNCWWSLSPRNTYDSSGANVWFTCSGDLATSDVGNGAGVRPAISLVSSTTISGGSGTSEDPYIVK